jgi:two-component system sensor histidine kinase KdpD
MRLRTPIATIIVAITLKENKTNYQANQTVLLSEVDIATIRLNRQVENLLNMSRLETGMLKIKRDWCDSNEIIYAAIQKNSTYKKTVTL